jgi:hypothetical protein
MTDRFDRIEKAFDNFRSKVEQCRDEANSNMADIQDAYNRMDILRNRIGVFSAGFLIGALGMYIAAYLYGYRKVT